MIWRLEIVPEGYTKKVVFLVGDVIDGTRKIGSIHPAEKGSFRIYDVDGGVICELKGSFIVASFVRRGTEYTLKEDF